MTQFTNRVFGCVGVKAINSNYNADFTHQPRTLPDGVVYATDKALKYSIRHYLKEQYQDEKIFYYKRLNKDLNPLTLDETYEHLFPKEEAPAAKKASAAKKAPAAKEVEEKENVLPNLLKCLDVRCFGATFASQKANLSIHGPIQINHGVNRFSENEIYSEQIMSPFRNPGKKDAEEKSMTTLGQQSKLREGHHIHHFSINPGNLSTICGLAGASGLTEDDIVKIKKAMCQGVSYYDSTSKAGSDNEFLLWVQLEQNSKLVLPVFTELIKVSKENDTTVIDFSSLEEIFNNNDIEKIEVYYLKQSTKVLGLPQKVEELNLYCN